MHPDRNPLVMGKRIGGRRIVTSLAILGPKLCAAFGCHFLAFYATIHENY
jgi:hypothetical protein